MRDYMPFLHLFRLTTTTMQTIIETAIRTLSEGNTLLYPTDTIWGLGCDATQAKAIERIYELKQRDHTKSMLILMEQGMMPALETFDDGGRPTTYIVSASQVPFALPDNLVAKDGTVGVRVPRHEFCQQLLHAFGKPIVSSSANFSGQPSPTLYADIDERLIAAVGYAVPNLRQFESHEQCGSRIVKVAADGTIDIIRP